MSKELPYFKFEPTAWDNGNIQLCSKESKGLFIDICCMYWVRLGELPYALALQKHCNGNTLALQELIDNEIIVIKDNYIIIEFLDEQLEGFVQLSETRRDAANKRWDAKAMQKQCKSNAIKIREDKSIEDKKRYTFSAPTIEMVKDYCSERGNKVNAESFMNHYEANGWMVGKNKMKDWKAAIRYWEQNNIDRKPEKSTVDPYIAKKYGI